LVHQNTFTITEKNGKYDNDKGVCIGVLTHCLTI